MLSKRVKVVVAPVLASIHIPLVSVFCTARPVMFNVGVAVATDPTLKVYDPELLLMVAPAADALSVPSIVSPLPLPSETLPVPDRRVRVPLGCTVSPPEKVCAALPTV